MTNHQRVGSVSNTGVGDAFEMKVFDALRPDFEDLRRPFPLVIGHIRQKSHRFDMGSAKGRTIVECKSHTWTAGGNMPSAKLTVWDQAMLYFYLAPRGWRKLFVVKHDIHPKSGQSLCAYYLRTHHHVIPDEVEFWEFDERVGLLSRCDLDLTAELVEHLD